MAKEYKPLDQAMNGEPTLEKGKRVTLVFVSNPSKWVRATQISIIEWRLNKNADIEIIRADYWGEDSISFTVEVKRTEALITERAIIALITSASPAGFYLMYKPGIEKGVTATIGKAKTIASWTPAAVAVAVIIAAFILLRK